VIVGSLVQNTNTLHIISGFEQRLRQAAIDPSVRRAVNELQSAVAKRHSRHHTDDLRRLNARKALTRRDFFQLHTAKPRT
jgi:hypothetical protein